MQPVGWAHTYPNARPRRQSRKSASRWISSTCSKKNLQSFVRLVQVPSQIVPYEDCELEQLRVFTKHLHPLLRIDRLQQDDVDLGELQLTHYRLSKRTEHQLRLSEEGGDHSLDLAMAVGSGKPHDPEKNASRKSSRRSTTSSAPRSATRISCTSSPARIASAARRM
jgi:hypothetical protein